MTERERLVELFGAPERWAATTRSSSGRRSTRSCRRSPARRVRVAGPVHLRPRAGRGQVPRLRCPTARRRSPFHFNGMVLYRDAEGAAGRAHPVDVLGSTGACRSRCGGETIDPHYPGGGWIAPAAETLEALRAGQARAGLPSFDACVGELLGEGDMATRSRSSSTRCSTRATALPVHAGRDQERDADAVRDRLPAGLRGRRRGARSTRADAASPRGRRRGVGGDAPLPRSRAASATRPSSGASTGRTSPSWRASDVEPFDNGRCTGACGWRPRRARRRAGA